MSGRPTSSARHILPEPSPADRFAALMWQYYQDGAAIDGTHLQAALELSGLADSIVEDGGLVLTIPSRACVAAGAAK